MKLLQELADREQFNEAVLEGDKARMRKMLNALEDNIERVSVQLMPNSQFAKQLAKVGGDTKFLASLTKKFNTVYDEMLDLIMDTNSVMVDEE